MSRKSFKEENAKKSPWLGAKKKPEKVIKPLYPEVSGELKCPYCGTINTITMYAQVVTDYPNDKFWAVGYCQHGECQRSICGWVQI